MLLELVIPGMPICDRLSANAFCWKRAACCLWAALKAPEPGGSWAAGGGGWGGATACEGAEGGGRGGGAKPPPPKPAPRPTRLPAAMARGGCWKFKFAIT